ncbi:hypothetical protein JTE90_002879 [Oedothorax gibbosus]|uniref:Uncharacterized protein n=1 Tax=Oedothorax gibbosus TaxID=931172 RepID=A0AAV6VD67_9ARAC|nr:hypothetical protein JTE90_002879 [Oedothorax gibbosus]
MCVAGVELTLLDSKSIQRLGSGRTPLCPPDRSRRCPCANTRPWTERRCSCRGRCGQNNVLLMDIVKYVRCGR